MFEEKNKAQRLQTELDVSEQVQRDFVKLSQTLQVRPAGTRGPAPWRLREGSGCGHRRGTLLRWATACTRFLSLPPAPPSHRGRPIPIPAPLPLRPSSAWSSLWCPVHCHSRLWGTCSLGPGGRLHGCSGDWKQPSKLAVRSCVPNSACGVREARGRGSSLLQSQQSAWVCRTAAPREQIALRGPVASKPSPLGRVWPEAQARVPVAS